MAIPIIPAHLAYAAIQIILTILVISTIPIISIILIIPLIMLAPPDLAMQLNLGILEILAISVRFAGLTFPTHVRILEGWPIGQC